MILRADGLGHNGWLAKKASVWERMPSVRLFVRAALKIGKPGNPWSKEVRYLIAEYLRVRCGSLGVRLMWGADYRRYH